MVSRDVFCLKGAQLVWLEACAEADEVTAQARDLGRTITCVPLQAPDDTPNPPTMQTIAFTPSGDHVSSAARTVAPGSPGKVHVLLGAGHFSMRKVM